MKARKFNPRIVLAIAVTLLAVIWISVIVAIMILQLDTMQRTALITIAALATEIGLYLGGAVFGITAFKRFRDKLRFRREK